MNTRRRLRKQLRRPQRQRLRDRITTTTTWLRNLARMREQSYS